ncbi:MAG: MFS transporter [Deltaproteobacteria bacterium]|nr:MFS transporter [Deltaproteobacteria bacterium]
MQDVKGFSAYADRRVWPIGLLGFSSGLPLLLTGGTLGAWLTESGLSLKSIAGMAAVGILYSFKFLWSPMVDHTPLPVLSHRLGQRRAWLLASQLGVVAALAALAMVDPANQLSAVVAAAVAVAFFSATQDIVIAAFRVERAGAEAQGAAAAIEIFGYRIGMLAAGAGALYVAEFASWRSAYLAMAGLGMLGAVTTLMCAEPVRAASESPAPNTFAGHLRAAVALPFLDFLRRPHWWAILLFATTFKLGDALAATMTNPFLLKIGFLKSEIASTTKVFGLLATLAGAAAGGALLQRVGVLRGLWIGGLLQLLSLVVFAFQAHIGHNVPALAATIGFEYAASAIGTAAFAAYLSSLCTVRYTATQYALLTSMAAVGRATLATRSGAIAEATGWFGFFLVCAAAAVPALLLLAWINRRDRGPRMRLPVVAEAVG